MWREPLEGRGGQALWKQAVQKSDGLLNTELVESLRKNGVLLEGMAGNNPNVWTIWIKKRLGDGEEKVGMDEMDDREWWKLELVVFAPMMCLRFARPFSNRGHWMVRENAFLGLDVSQELLPLRTTKAVTEGRLAFLLETVAAMVRDQEPDKDATESEVDDSVVQWNDPGPARWRKDGRGDLPVKGPFDGQSYLERKGYRAEGGDHERIWWAYHCYCSSLHAVVLRPDGRVAVYSAVEGASAVARGLFTSAPRRLSPLRVLAWAVVRERMLVGAARGCGEENGGEGTEEDPQGARWGMVEREYRQCVGEYRIRFSHFAFYRPEESASHRLQSRWLRCAAHPQLWSPAIPAQIVVSAPFSDPALPAYEGAFQMHSRYRDGSTRQWGN